MRKITNPNAVYLTPSALNLTPRVIVINIVLVVVLVLVLEIEGANTASRTTTSTRTSTNRMTNSIGIPQFIMDPKKFLFSIRLAVFGPEAALNTEH